LDGNPPPGICVREVGDGVLEVRVQGGEAAARVDTTRRGATLELHDLLRDPSDPDNS